MAIVPVSSEAPKPDIHKLKRLPKDAKITKRPLIRPAIPSPYTGRANAKIVYISTKTPFMSAIHRIKQLFKHIDARDTQAELARQRNLFSRKGKGKVKLGSHAVIGDEEEKPEAVIVKATGKAIAKALSIALFLQGCAEYDVKIGTGTVGAIDDISREGDYVGEGQKESQHEVSRDAGGSAGLVEPKDVDMEDDEKANDNDDGQVREDEEDDIPEARVRYTSMIEIVVTLR